MKTPFLLTATAFLGSLLIATGAEKKKDPEKKSGPATAETNKAREKNAGRSPQREQRPTANPSPQREKSANRSGERKANPTGNRNGANRQEKKPRETTERPAAKRDSAPRPDRKENAGKKTAPPAERKSAPERLVRKDTDRQKAPQRTEKNRNAADKERAAITGNRPDAKQTPAKRKAKTAPVASKQPLALPGKRPAVSSRLKPLAQRSKAVQRRDAKADKKGNRNIVGKRPAPVVRPGQNTKSIRRPLMAERRANENRWWMNNRTTKNVTNVRNVNVTHVTNINRNFRENVNWSTRRQSWGYNPWWNRPQVRPWYASTWRGGWSRDYYRNYYPYHHRSHGYRPPGYSRVGVSIGWGLVGWSLGTMVYDLGYRSYSNPYPVLPVAYDGGEVSYHQPITRVAVSTAPRDESILAENTEASESFIAESQAAFEEKNYLVALELADKAIAKTPGDGALHEYRALILFSLGKYGEAAGTLNPVLASGPGWDYPTMLALYDEQSTYTAQLTRLEEYSEANPNKGDAHFLLGYHYMVTGHMDLAAAQFDRANEITPADKIAAQLAQLARASSSDPEKEAAAALEEDSAIEETAPEIVPVEKLSGKWVAKAADQGEVVIDFKPDGKFVWSHGDNTLQGDYSMNDDGMLVLDSDENQMVAEVSLPQDNSLNFVLVGGPPEDPGMNFTKS